MSKETSKVEGSAARAYTPMSRLHTGPTPFQARPEMFAAYSVVEDTKRKVEAVAKSNSGKLELFSPQYYAACTVGGMMACVSQLFRTEPPSCS
jgi:hypothetical protein